MSISGSLSRRLIGKTAIVTGGASGIGEAISAAFHAEGANVCIADANHERAAEMAENLGSRATSFHLDIRDIDTINATIKATLDRFGAVDVLVNSAGVFGLEALIDISPSEFDRIMGINARGLLFAMQRVARSMIAQGNGGAIINIASGAGRRGAPGAGSYAASKAAVISLTQTAATELIAHGIRVNAIAPGAVRTPLWDDVKRRFAENGAAATADFEALQIAATPAGRLALAEDFTGIAIFLACQESAHIVGQTINVDGGVMMN